MSNSRKILTLCTGNVARSVMLSYMLTTIADASGENWSLRSAGTLVSEGVAMSSRTRDALLGLEELGEHHYNAHRSAQVTLDDLEWADVVLCAEAQHVDYVRRAFPDASAKTVLLWQFVRDAPLGASFDDQVRFVAASEPDPSLDVIDPAGGTQEVYDKCAMLLWELAQAFGVVTATD